MRIEREQDMMDSAQSFESHNENWKFILPTILAISIVSESHNENWKSLLTSVWSGEI